ncbi:MAG: MoaD/ThiS family protein, partial [Brachybacterium sp.]|nr:MoaD/ThiS family protein [Brachybacterium sp.]
MSGHDATPPDGAELAPLIEVRLFAAAAAALGGDRMSVPAGTVRELLASLAEHTDDEGARVLERSSLLVNAVASRDRDQELGPGDQVDVLP